MSKQTIVIIILAILVLGAAGYFIYQSGFRENSSAPENNGQQNTAPENTTNQENQPNNTPLLGGDKDEHNCIGSAGYSWCEAKMKCLRVFEEFCPDAVAKLTESVKKETGVELSYSSEGKFDWLVSKNNEILKTALDGVVFSAGEIKRADYNKVEEYMNKNYQADNTNMADGVEGGLRGYYVNYMACALNFRHMQIKDNEQGISEPVGDNLKVSLECGFFNKNN